MSKEEKKEKGNATDPPSNFPHFLYFAVGSTVYR